MAKTLRAVSPSEETSETKDLRENAAQIESGLRKPRFMLGAEQSHALCNAIDAIVHAIDAGSKLEKIYIDVLNGLQRAFGVERASIEIFDPDGHCRFKAWRGLSEEFRKSFEGYAPWTQEPIDPVPMPAIDVERNIKLRSYLPAFAKENIRSLAFVPLIHRGRALGALTLYSQAPYNFKREQKFALTIGKLIAFGIFRQNVVEQRQKSLRDYQELVDSIDGIVWEITPDFQFKFVSKQAERILGYPIEKWKSERDFWANHIHPDDRERAVAFCKAQCDSLQDHDFDYRMIAADGHVVHLRDLVHVVIEDGKLAGLKGIMVDITSQKKTSEELQNSYSLLYTMLESTADGILAVDLTGKITWVNHKFVELWRLPAASLDQHVDAKVIKSVLKQLKAPDRFLSQIRKLYANPEAESYDVIDFLDGRVFERYSQAQRLNNKIVGRVWSFRDITKQNQAATQLKELSDRLSKLMASVSDFLCSAIVDSKGKKTSYIFCSPAAEKITGRPPAFYLSDPARWTDIIFPEDRRRVECFVSELTAKGHHQQGELDYRIVRPNGEIRWVRDSVTTTKMKSGETRLDGVVSDITERKLYSESRERLLAQETEARKEAERAVQLRDDFLSIATHELRTPLTPIRMNLRLIERDIETLAPELPRVEYLRRAVQGTEREFERFLKLVENLLDVSRIRAGRLVLNRRELDLSDLVRLVIGRLNAELKRSECEVHLRSQGEIIGKWDPERIEQVVVNLLSNAIKYGAGKPIEITASKTATHALLQIKDQGIGISKADQGRIFHRFERLAPIKNFGGFGLGLFIALEIAEAHGGTIRVESEPDMGSTFTVELPLGGDFKI